MGAFLTGIKENRTYDQVLGGIARANGDLRFCMYEFYGGRRKVTTPLPARPEKDHRVLLVISVAVRSNRNNPQKDDAGLTVNPAKIQQKNVTKENS